MTDKLPRFIDINDNPVYLKKIIGRLIELNNCPDIHFKYFIDSYSSWSKTKVVAEITLCTGGSIMVIDHVDSRELQNKDFKEYVENSLLERLAYKYIKRAYDKRKTGKVKVKAEDFNLNLACVVLKDEQVKECEDDR